MLARSCTVGEVIAAAFFTHTEVYTLDRFGLIFIPNDGFSFHKTVGNTWEVNKTRKNPSIIYQEDEVEGLKMLTFQKLLVLNSLFLLFFLPYISFSPLYFIPTILGAL